MGDLTEKQAGGTTKIIGADPNTGEESFFAEVTSEGELKISSFANVTFITDVKSYGTTPTLACVGVANLANRKSLVIYNRGPQEIYYGDSGVNQNNGIIIEKDELVELQLGENIQIYLTTKTGTSQVIIQEFA